MNPCAPVAPELESVACPQTHLQANPFPTLLVRCLAAGETVMLVMQCNVPLKVLAQKTQLLQRA